MLCFKCMFYYVFVDDWQWVGGGVDNDVGFFQLFVDIVEGYYFGVYFFCQCLGVFMGVVGDYYFVYVMFVKMVCYQFNGFIGVDQ